jgi:hypothetical protein
MDTFVGAFLNVRPNTADMEMVIIYPVFIGMALAEAQLAHAKGYSSRWWFLIGLLLPLISLPVLFLLRKKEKSQTGYHAPVVHEVKDRVLYRRDA